MEQSLSTAIFVITTVLVSVFFVNGVASRLNSGARSAAAAITRMEQRMTTDMTVMHGAVETDAGQTYLRLWLRNTGARPVDAVRRMEIMLTSTTASQYFPYGTGPNKWQYTVLSGGPTEWTAGGTIRLEIQLASPLAAGQYNLTLTTFNGAQAKYTFSV